MRKAKYLVILSVFLGCQEASKENSKTNLEPIEFEEEKIVLQAKQNADSVFHYINMSVDLMTKKKLSAESEVIIKIMSKAKPFQDSLDSLKNLLSPQKVKEVDEYRQILFNKVQSNGY